ncbi:MAG TPA: hypothetical protein PKD05_17560 [Candidatus Melainabacteria bacterium]|nr:hypothetical protein [Candidatus Melainabacteria bacterium]
MNFKLLGIPGKLLVLTALLALVSAPARAQGIAEYGGLMGKAPKNSTSPSPKTLKNLY